MVNILDKDISLQLERKEVQRLLALGGCGDLICGILTRFGAPQRFLDEVIALYLRRLTDDREPRLTELLHDVTRVALLGASAKKLEQVRFVLVQQGFCHDADRIACHMRRALGPDEIFRLAISVATSGVDCAQMDTLRRFVCQRLGAAAAVQLNGLLVELPQPVLELQVA